MKYIVVLGDGMGDYPLTELQGATPLQHAATPAIDFMAQRGVLGLVKTIPEGMAPGSDIANLSVLGYNPKEFYTGRSPFEAAGMGIDMDDSTISFRCNLVTLSFDEGYSHKIMLDYSSGEIASDEAAVLIEVVDNLLGCGPVSFHAGKSYRHLMLWSGGSIDCPLTPPHDITGKKIGPYLPSGKYGDKIRAMMEKSYDHLCRHHVNLQRTGRGLNPANSIWIWGEGRRPMLPDFLKKYHLKGSVISAVDLIKGISLCAGLEFIEVEGATGNIYSNLRGKAEAAIDTLKNGKDFVYIHIEAPDECGHRKDILNKIRAIELIDTQVVAVLKERLDREKMEYKIMILPDHFTPLSLGTHTTDPVPFLIYQNSHEQCCPSRTYDEISAGSSGLFIEKGFELLDFFFAR